MSDWAVVLIFLIGSVVFVMIGLLTAKIIRPNKPNLEKLSTYESGEEAIGNAWGKFNVRYLTIAILFLLFEIEIVFFFPWATVYTHPELLQRTNGSWTNFALVEMFVFVLILVLGLAYAWSKGFLDWVKSNQKPSGFQSVIPKKLYENLNKNN